VTFTLRKKHNDACAFKVQGNNLFKILILIKTEIVEVNPIQLLSFGYCLTTQKAAA
jgi:hypothetical protein